MRRFIRQMAWLFCLSLCTLFCVHAAASEEAVDTEARGTLTVSYSYGTDSESENNLALTGVRFRLYRIASVSTNGTWSLTDDFSGSGVTNAQLNSLEYAQDVSAAVDTLVAWIKENESGTDGNNGDSEAETEKKSSGSDQQQISTVSGTTQNGIAATQEAVTDAAGTAVFENLQTGVYLLIGDSLTDETITYSNSPSLVSIPSVNSEGTGWEYEITVNAKAEAVSLSLDPEPDTEAVSEALTETETEAETETSTEYMPTGAYAEPAAETSNSSSSKYSSEYEVVTDTQTESGTESGTESETTDAGAVQTGDDTPVMMWLMLLLGSCGMFVICLKLKRRYSA